IWALVPPVNLEGCSFADPKGRVGRACPSPKDGARLVPRILPLGAARVRFGSCASVRSAAGGQTRISAIAVFARKSKQEKKALPVSPPAGRRQDNSCPHIVRSSL